MDIKYIDEFLYIAETLSFKQTAEHFYVSRSVISRHISALEAAIGVRLLERDSHAVRLTKAGEVFHREAQMLSRTWAMAMERTRQAGDGDYVLVRIGYLRNAARPVLAHFVRAMEAFHPDIKLSLACMDHRELVQAIADQAVDIALAVNVDAKLSRNYRFTPIYHDHFTVVCAKDHPLAAKVDGIVLDDLYDQTLLLPDSFVYGRTAEFIRDLTDEETMHVSRSSYSDADMLTLKVETEGVLAFSSTRNNEIFRDRLAVLPLLGIDTDFSVSAFYREGFDDAACDACREVFEWCHDNMCTWYPDLSLVDCGE
ncbi:MAG: LysR family transcriptional regulator [Coriobacteriales bacterium]